MNIDEWKKKGFELVDGKLIEKGNKKSYNKYRNSRTVVDGIKFDSKKESEYYSKLKLLKKVNEILDFEMQVKMPIKIKEIHISNYILDFKVVHLNSSIEYIDIKGQDKKSGKFITTDVFKLKKKLIEAIYNIKITLK